MGNGGQVGIMVAGLALLAGGAEAQPLALAALERRPEAVTATGADVLTRDPAAGLEPAASALPRLAAAVRHEPEERDSLLNGVLIGIGAGVVTGMIVTHRVCATVRVDDECGMLGFVVLTMPLAASGGGIGALIDFAIRRRRPPDPGTARATRIDIVPSVGPAARALHARIAF